MENRWAEPSGVEARERPRPVLYRIMDRDTDEVVERCTRRTQDHSVRGGRWFHSFDDRDQHFADAIVDLVQAACTYFWVPDEWYVGLDGVADVMVTDDEVRARIDRLNRGENQREAERVATALSYPSEMTESYPLDRLPWGQQRALVEQIEALKRAWRFEILGEADEDYEEDTYQWEPGTAVMIVHIG